MSDKLFFATLICTLAMFAIMEDSPWLAFFLVLIAYDVAVSK